jgi:hypothetical protein
VTGRRRRRAKSPFHSPLPVRLTGQDVKHGRVSVADQLLLYVLFKLRQLSRIAVADTVCSTCTAGGAALLHCNVDPVGL